MRKTLAEAFAELAAMSGTPLDRQLEARAQALHAKLEAFSQRTHADALSTAELSAELQTLAAELQAADHTRAAGELRETVAHLQHLAAELQAAELQAAEIIIGAKKAGADDRWTPPKLEQLPNGLRVYVVRGVTIAACPRCEQRRLLTFGLCPKCTTANDDTAIQNLIRRAHVVLDARTNTEEEIAQALTRIGTMPTPQRLPVRGTKPTSRLN